MGGSIGKFVAQVAECDFRETCCPKCETTCDQCDKVVSTPMTGGSPGFSVAASFSSGHGSSAKLAWCTNHVVDLPSSEFSKNLITVTCLECIQRNHWTNSASMDDFYERADAKNHFDLTECSSRVIRNPRFKRRDMVYKCCIKCTDDDPNIDCKLLKRYRGMKVLNMTYCHIEQPDDFNPWAQDDDDALY